MLDNPRPERKLVGFSLQYTQVSNNYYLPESNCSSNNFFLKVRKGGLSGEVEAKYQFHVRKAFPGNSKHAQEKPPHSESLALFG